MSVLYSVTYCSSECVGAYSDNFWATVCKTVALCYQTIVCLSCLSVTLVYCGQTVGWIKMKLDMQVGLSPGNSVLDRDPAPRYEKGHSSPPQLTLLWHGCPSPHLLSSC